MCDYRLNKFDIDFSSKSYVFMVLSRSGYFVILPEPFDIDNHLKEYPIGKYFEKKKLKFDKVKLLHVLGLLSSIPAYNNDLIVEDGYIPIHAKTIKNYFKDYLIYIDYLLDTDVIESDNHYIKGEKSIGYRWKEEYLHAPSISVSTENFEDFSALKQIAEKESNTLHEFEYLTYWYQNKGLKIDISKAEKYAFLLRNKKLKLGYEEWDINKDTYPIRKKNPHNQYLAIMHNLNALKIHDYNAHIDNNVHRLHSVLTNMQKEYRNFITHSSESEKLIAIDVKNCQPYLVCALLSENFWIKDNTNNSKLNIYNLPTNIQELYTINNTNASISIMMGNYISSLKENAFEEYISLVAKGEMYETIIDWVKYETGKEILRSDAKTTMFSMLFSSNRGYRNDGFEWLRKYYNKRFPEINELFKLIKKTYKGLGKKQHARLACLLQSIESEIILHRCCKRIWQEKGSQVPIYTIHDSIVTTIEHQDYVKDVITEEFTCAIGVAPSLDSEIWIETNLDKEILSRLS